MASYAEMLRNIEDMMIEDIMSLSEEELRAELIEAGEDPDQIVADMKAMFDKIFREYDRRCSGSQESEDDQAINTPERKE